jgi:DNA adenine methylase
MFKWVGGKGNLVDKIIPKILETHKKTYLEPFLGGGSVMLKLLEVFDGHIFVNDLNTDLIEAWLAIKNNVEALIQDLMQYDTITEEKYVPLRTEFNATPSSIHKSSLFIILNHSSYGGLYRVNRKGQFNVPYGNYWFNIKEFLDKFDLRALSQKIQNVTFEHMDYKSFITKHLNADTVIYMDPPYFQTFQKYTNQPFDYNAFNDYLNELTQHTSVIVSNTQEWYDRVKPLWNGCIPITVFERMAARHTLQRHEVICIT